ncbi:MAG: LCP family protein [Candidatus Melainabacteria bacterium]|nr:LCP family protein [Candidatus Melainabacteria bacterium]
MDKASEVYYLEKSLPGNRRLLLLAVNPTQPKPAMPTPSPGPFRPNTVQKPSLPPPRRHRWKKVLLFLSTVLLSTLLLLLIAVSIFGPRLGSFSNVDPRNILQLPILNDDQIVLLMGVDSNQFVPGVKDGFQATRSDTMLLVRLSPRYKTISVVSIPRDSKVFLPNGSVGKINSAHAIGGAEYAVKTVTTSFGIPVSHYMVVDLKGIRDVVDAVGGVDVYVEKPMHYRDRTAKLTIDFEVGTHHLNGAQAEAYLRFRHDALGDIGRIRRQQYFLSALADRMKDPLMLPRLPGLVHTVSKYVQTDLEAGDLLKMAAFARSVDLASIRTATIPGNPSGPHNTLSYWIVNPEATQKLLDHLILNVGSHQEASSAATGALRVGILYDRTVTTHLPNLTERLKNAGYEVLCQQPTRGAKTRIVEHSYHTTDEDLQRFRRHLPALSKVRLVFAPVNTTYESVACDSRADYTVVLGQDAVRFISKGKHHDHRSVDVARLDATRGQKDSQVRPAL